MSTKVHFINVGQGNMVLIQSESGQNFLMDCNVTNDNEFRVLNYVGSNIGWRTPITAFICSHRDADHIRGIEKVNEIFPIREVWDSGFPGTTTNSPEYISYMYIRNRVATSVVVDRDQRWSFGSTKLWCLSASDNRLLTTANSQGIVLKVEHRLNYSNLCVGSVMLTGDSDSNTWRDGILRDYHPSALKSDILMAGHHGSDTFFESSATSANSLLFTSHIEAISPDMSVISVGSNGFGHPNRKALSLYEKYSRGSDTGMKLARTDLQGTIRLEIGLSSTASAGNWRMEFFC